jgi:hypothetical protein
MRRLVGSNPTPAASQAESLMTKGIDERRFPLSERPRSSMLGAASLERSILGAGESVNAVVLGSGLNINWGATTGFLRYRDSGGTEWLTHFRYQEVFGGMEVVVTEVGTTSELGEPRYSPEGRAPS